MAIIAFLLTIACTFAGAQTDLLPWQAWVETAAEDQIRPLDSLWDLPWRSSGGKEGSLSLDATGGPDGGKQLRFDVEIDHFNEGKYPMGWPSFETQPGQPFDLSGYDALQYWIRCDTALERKLSLRFILWANGSNKLNTPLPDFEPGKWVLMTHRINEIADMDKVDRIHFFLCENEYQHGDKMTFRVAGFRLCNLKREASRLAPEQAAAGLWTGDRADSGDQAVILEPGDGKLPCLVIVETAADCRLQADDTLRLRFHEVFSGEETPRTVPLGQSIGEGQVTRISREFDIATLQPGYYLAVADILRDGESVLGGRVGCDDFYIRKPDESLTCTVLSIRTGMATWVRDLLHGDIMCRTRIALPHVYDPLDESTYADFIGLFAHTTGKHTEGNEAGDTGLALAAEAFRRSGDMVRCRYAEWLLEDSYDHMIEKMQAPSGAAITWANELADAGIGKGGRSNSFGSYDSNQIGEWMRAITYGIIYYSRIPEKREYARKLSAACRGAAEYIATHSTQDSDGLPRVIRHLRLQEDVGGSVTQVTYEQEKRQCDVYLGRALAGLSYYAYAMQLLGERVPDHWWQIMDNTVTWSDRKMKPNGWFDWQCEDVVEGGCHTFLGNLYIGEGLFGCYLASAKAGRQDAARAAQEATHRAYRYVTDDCWIRGTKFEYPLEFWVGPYVYWLFTEYQDTIGKDEAFDDWLTVLDRKWSVEREWRDFLDRALTGGCGRTATNGMLEISILGYLGIKQMSEIGQPLHWEL